MPAERAKQRRAKQACDFCHSRGTRCRSDDTEATNATRSCATCTEYGEICRWTRAPKKRGTKPGTTSGAKQASFWKERVLRDRESISSLLDVYLDTIHPVFPLYCERELWVGWRESTFPATSAQYASLICMCALSAQHAEQGSLFEKETPLDNSTTGADTFVTKATTLVQADQPDILDLEFIRACGFLALLGLQSGDYKMLHKYLAMYHGTCARFNLHDETHWGSPSEKSTCEHETRRRLYWAIYRLEVHSACVLGHMIRVPEVQSNVDYPTGLHHPPFVPGRDGDFEDWFAGWNTTTDLYRILENTIVEFRVRKRRHESLGMEHRPTREVMIRQRIVDVQQRALPQFKQVHEKSTDSGRNRCSFQATNILFTIHLIRMFTVEPTPQSMQGAAEALLESVTRIPPEYIRANGRRLLEELAGTALMLGTVAARASTSEEEAQSLLSLQEMLASFIETSALANGTAAALMVRLRRQIAERGQRFTSIDPATEDDAAPAGHSQNEAQDDQWWEQLGMDELMSETAVFDSHLPGLLLDPRWPD